MAHGQQMLCSVCFMFHICQPTRFLLCKPAPRNVAPLWVLTIQLAGSALHKIITRNVLLKCHLSANALKCSSLNVYKNMIYCVYAMFAFIYEKCDIATLLKVFPAWKRKYFVVASLTLCLSIVKRLYAENALFSFHFSKTFCAIAFVYFQLFGSTFYL